MRVSVPLATGFGKAASAVASGGRLVNLYAQPAPSGAKDALVIVGVPGAKPRAQLRFPNDEGQPTDETLIHAILPAFDSLIVVAQRGIYRVLEDMTWTRLGGGLPGPVSMAWNGIDVAAVNGVSARWITASTVSNISDPDFYPADSVSFLDGYLIFNRRDTGQFFCTEPYSRAFEGLAFGTAEKDPDHTVGVFANRDAVMVFGDQTVEFWENAGAGQFPFRRIPGAVLEHGCASPASVARYSDFVAWLTPKGVVMAAVGFSPQRVSDEQVESALASRRRDWASARAFAYEEDGHSFYVLTVGDLTLAYDIGLGEWHQRSNDSRGSILGRAYAFAWGKHWIGDDRGRILEMSREHLDDAGEPLIAEMVTPPYHAEREVLSVYSLELQMDTGAYGVGTPPQVAMAFSDDQGRTWSQERLQKLGRAGRFKDRVIWRRCGGARDRCFRFRISDPVKRAFLSTAFMEVG